MNCHEFENHVVDLAGDRLMEATFRRRLVAHAADCRKCDARLTQERLLTTSLAALAESTEGATAAPDLKKTLLGAFDQQPMIGPRSSVISNSDNPKSKVQNPKLRLLVAAAAVFIAAFLAVASFFMRPASVDGPNLVRENPPPTPRTEPTPVPKPADSANKPDQSKPEPQTQPKPVRRSRPTTIRNVGSPTVARRSEITTDYIPLMYTSDATSIQSGLVVRLEIPRTTLLSMGLPVSTERGNALVKADVVVGDDGVARAIRLVH